MNVNARHQRHVSRPPLSVRWIVGQTISWGAWRQWLAVGALNLSLNRLFAAQDWIRGKEEIRICAKRSSNNHGAILWRILIKQWAKPLILVDVYAEEIRSRTGHWRSIPPDVVLQIKRLLAPLAHDPVIAQHLQTAQPKSLVRQPKPIILFWLSRHNFIHTLPNRESRARRRPSASSRRLLPPLVAAIVLEYWA